MYKSIQFLSIALFAVFATSCNQDKEARKPISKSKESIIQSSALKNMNMVKSEEELISQYIETDKDNTYINSKNGFWYSYQERKIHDSIRPSEGNTVMYTYEISTLQDSLLYSSNDIGVLSYIVDKEDILPILRHSIKLMKKNESIKVLSPSILAYSYLGDRNKIGKNQPLIFTIDLKSIEKSN
ncbi:gliding motility-associated peptidyl-prolyl isomerase GldI [Myroides odoratimimus]|uniref:gliding motility-associated peptidyl-prolyl isomerase GldI n=1 Tax=Myroides odoratimimus TaxID=76832 RepID=UPI002DBC8F9B|nr:gliding motility-associated peptidyl-prolyl isomerase GldI [Myroides odoratimimus]MEC4053658.1 gliding motility-associated peptidyl-prolyl isomerase GldI [Myroides odoratimimus]